MAKVRRRLISSCKGVAGDDMANFNLDKGGILP
jgi:hypothetical protein